MLHRILGIIAFIYTLASLFSLVLAFIIPSDGPLAAVFALISGLP